MSKNMAITKEQWVELAEGATNQSRYEHDVYKAICDITKKYGMSPDFLGVPFSTEALGVPADHILGDEFSFWLYDCDGDFDEYESRVENEEGRRPVCQSLGDLYDHTVGEGRWENKE